MRFDLKELSDLITRHHRVTRIVVADTKGSAPRDAGTAMLVWDTGQRGTIGGGTLEYQAIAAARDALEQPGEWQRALSRVPLGPSLGQCCGGSVTLLTEVYGETELAGLQAVAESSPIYARTTESGKTPATIITSGSGLTGGWMIEPFIAPRQPLWIYGAGHVGRALVNILPPLGFDITWVDTAGDRFPDPCPKHVTRLVAASPADVVHYAPLNARHLVLTYSHALDLEICHNILSHAFLSAGLIGSATKWARFRKRLANLGHKSTQINRITCPIGLPELGKEPESIAVGVATELLLETRTGQTHSQTPKERAS